MYVPKANAEERVDVIAEMIDAANVANLVTQTADGLVATLLPMLWDRPADGHGSLVGHVARANSQWRSTLDGSVTLAIFTGPDAYVSPSWYPSKQQEPRVVPTWNYSAVHVYGSLVVHDDAEWKLGLVRRLTERHERRREPRWSVDDAPAEYIDRMLGAIVGLELVITRIEAKRKMSQNRDQGDIDGVVAALDVGTARDRSVAADMGRDRS